LLPARAAQPSYSSTNLSTVDNSEKRTSDTTIEEKKVQVTQFEKENNEATTLY
jgi:hypothetical protein